LLAEASRNRARANELRALADRIDRLVQFDELAEVKGGAFISYSHADRAFVSTLASRLEADGINYWLDEKNLLVGEVIDKAISKAIQEYRLFLVVLTPASIRSAWLERELDEAAHEEAEGKKIILPVLAILGR
jgi:TIR domain